MASADLQILRDISFLILTPLKKSKTKLSNCSFRPIQHFYIFTIYRKINMKNKVIGRVKKLPSVI